MARTAIHGGGGAKSGNKELSYIPLPTTEAEANSDVFVAEMTGAANSNVIGTGANMDGVDLVLTRNGTIDGMDGEGFRRLSTTSSGFTVTDNFLNTFLGPRPVFHYGTCTQRVTPPAANHQTIDILAYTANSTFNFASDWDTRGGKNIVVFHGYQTTASDLYNPVRNDPSFRGAVSFNAGASWVISYDPVNGLFVTAIKYGLQLPQTVEDFDVLALSEVDNTVVEDVTSVSRAYLVGDVPGYAAIHDTDFVVAAKKPSFFME